ncbi:MAG: hypothetical protein BroJett011_06630 [Chloroflexota bacterium]|nr:MAG: hypothetical protein BroJett011_06630 [Chloroflexota bacterium]
MIDYLIHFYRKDTVPFRSLSALSDVEAMQLMHNLYIEGSIFWERFKDPAEYLQARRQIEQWLHQEFIAKGGAPKESYPIYMILGRSKWLLTAADAMTVATTAEIQVPLSLFGEGEISFTYPDSMVSMWLATQKDSAYYLPDYHGKLFTLSEVRAIIEANGLPGETWGTNLPSFLANYIEAQVWNHAPLLAPEKAKYFYT